MFRFDKEYTEWNLERISRHMLYWGFWALFYPIMNTSYNDGLFSNWLLFELIVMPVKILNSYFIAYYLIPKYLYLKKYITFFIWVIVSCIIAGAVTRILDAYIVWPFVFGDEPFSPFASTKILYKILDQMNIAAFIVIIKFIQRQLRQERSHADLKEEKLDAELKLLKNQLQPHFLFNTLNNLYGMVLTKDPKAADVLLKLSDMLSYMLYECEDDTVPIEKELKILNNYIELEQIRYGKKLSFEFSKEGIIDGKRIAPLLLFPLLENAFKHGAAKVENNPFIRVFLRGTENEIHFKVENSRQIEQNRPTNTTSGIGLENVKTRLKLIYPNHHKLSINSDNDKFEVDLIIKHD